MRPLKGFALAFSMLTIIPFFKVHDFFKGINGYGVLFYPIIGFILGSLLWLISFVLVPYIPPVHLSVVLFGLWVLLTGALHLDGLSDTIDGLFVSKERALEVMKDSHVGGMGMILTFVFLALKLSSVVAFEAYYLLPLVLMLSRLNASLAIYFYNYVGGGMSLLAKEEFTNKQLLVSLLYTLSIALFFAHSFTLIFGALIALLLIARFFTQRLGGLSGDIYGLIIESTELLLLNIIIIQNFS